MVSTFHFACCRTGRSRWMAMCRAGGILALSLSHLSAQRELPDMPPVKDEVGEITGDRQRSMSLKECVIVALQEGYGLRIRAIDMEIAAAQLGAAKGAYDPVLSATVSVDDVTTLGGIDSETREFQQSKTDTWRGSAAVSGLLPTGGQYTVGASVSDTEGTSAGFAFENASGRGPFIEFRQPLLENFAIDDARLNIQVSRQNLEISILDFQLAMMQTVNLVEEAYFNLVAAREFVKVQESAQELADQLWRENRRRVELGDLAPIEEAEARSQASASQADVLVARRLVLDQQNALKGLMVDDFMSWQPVTLLPEGGLSDDPAAFDFDSSWAHAVVARPDLQILNVQLEQRFLIEARRRNELLPELDLTASAGYTGSNREISGVLDQVGSRDAPYYGLGFSLALPLQNRRERENHRIAVAQTEQAKLQLRQSRQNLMIEIDNAVNQARTAFERIRATREARAFAEQALANEQGKLDRGASTNFVVLQLQRNLTAARSEELQSLTDYNKSLSRLRLLEGVNLQAHQVEVTIE